MSNFMMLLVEDDATQRGILAEFLRDGNYEVVECATAEAAELIVASAGTELRALVTDQSLAGDMTGRELATYARDRYPGLRIIVMSGQTLTELPERTTFLHKPFPALELLKAVQ